MARKHLTKSATGSRPRPAQSAFAAPPTAEPSTFSWRQLGGGQRITVIAALLLLSLGAAGAGLKYLDETAKREQAASGSVSNFEKPEPSLLLKVNPFTAPPTPAPTPQLSKEYIYAGSRMLAVEDAHASAAPPADLAVWRPSNGYWYVLGGTQGSQQTFTQWGQNGDQSAPGDYDGDGHTDFSVFRPASSTWYITYSGSGTAYGLTFGTTGDRIAPADFDGDGTTDIAVFRNQSPNGWWYVAPSNNPSNVVGYQFGLGSDVPAPADYDGDGRADYAVWRAADKTFYIRKSSTSQVQAITLSAPATDGVPVSADYDGDGKADAAIKSSTTNNWFIVPSSGAGAMQTIAWQQTGDVAVQNDYDADGKADIAAWRPSGTSVGVWFIRQSSRLGQANELRQVAWGQAGDTPVPAYYRR